MWDDTDGRDDGAPGGGDLARALRREADTVVPGAPPVEAVVRRGRTLRFRRRVAAGGAVVAVAALPVSVVLWPPLGSEEPTPPAAQDTPSPERDTSGDATGPTDGGETGDGPATSSEVREVTADERVELGQGVVLGLLPGTGPRYAVAPEEEWEEAAEAAAGEPPDPTTLSAELVPAGDTTLVVGGWRVLDDTPEIRLDGPEGGVNVTTVTLTGEEEWGVFYADLGPAAGPVTVEYRDSDGELVASAGVDGAPAP